ncbi:MAG: PfkB family carbohydrate kinase [Prolixibacteraceae bacterium]|jgi:fructokinase|nr:PfkB family carbohydrate kinase [Prolixibacteraceae bacterium]
MKNIIVAMSKIYTVGETTFDIIFRNGQPSAAVVGGSVLNTAITLGRLKLPVQFVSRMGNDHVGELSLDFLKKNGVEPEFVIRFDGNSRLALAFMDESNNADYEFYRADESPSLIFPELASNDIVTFGSTNAIKEEGRNNLLLFLNQAHDKDVLTIYDPNIREFGPRQLIETRKKVEENLHLAKVLKGSNQDFMRLYETNNADEIFEIVRPLGVQLLIVTSGVEKVELRTSLLSLTFPVTPVKTVSTIGAGDNFTAGLVYGFYIMNIRTANIQQVDEGTWLEIIQYAADFAAQVCCSESNYISNEYADEILRQ